MTTLDLAAVRYPDIDDRPHEPGGGPDWQESYVFAWWDEDAGIGGFFRSGHETGRGAASALVGLVTADGLRYRRNLEALPLTAADRKDDTFAVAARGLGGVPPTKGAGAATEGAYSVRFGDGTRRYYAVTSGQEVGRQVGSDHYQVLRRPRRLLRPRGVEQPAPGNGAAPALRPGGQRGRSEPTVVTSSVRAMATCSSPR